MGFIAFCVVIRNAFESCGVLGEHMSEAAQDDFRLETRAWLEENCPPGAKGEGQTPTGSSKISITDPDVILWLERAAEKGFTVPTWPVEYGGAGLTTQQFVVLVEELRRIDARAPLMGMGTSLIGPTLL
jgi:alkylation response protein AidB-like acyl-CoA dehydrogenase